MMLPAFVPVMRLVLSKHIEQTGVMKYSDFDLFA